MVVREYITPHARKRAAQRLGIKGIENLKKRFYYAKRFGRHVASKVPGCAIYVWQNVCYVKNKNTNCIVTIYPYEDDQPTPKRRLTF